MTRFAMDRIDYERLGNIYDAIDGIDWGETIGLQRDADHALNISDMNRRHGSEMNAIKYKHDVRDATTKRLTDKAVGGATTNAAKWTTAMDLAGMMGSHVGGKYRDFVKMRTPAKLTAPPPVPDADTVPDGSWEFADATDGIDWNDSNSSPGPLYKLFDHIHTRFNIPIGR